jgi:hypothetical protein
MSSAARRSRPTRLKSGGCGQRAQIRDDLQRLRLGHGRRRRHRRVRDTAHDDSGYLVVGIRPAKQAAAEIDARDEVAVGAVARRARTLIGARAVLDVECRRVLRARREPGRQQ